MGKYTAVSTRCLFVFDSCFSKCYPSDTTDGGTWWTGWLVMFVQVWLQFSSWPCSLFMLVISVNLSAHWSLHRHISERVEPLDVDNLSFFCPSLGPHYRCTFCKDPCLYPRPWSDRKHVVLLLVNSKRSATEVYPFIVQIRWLSLRCLYSS
jgi:hypothetical protein